jgi:3-oxoacyl-[acyl-carrier protein] reductase
MAEKVNVADSEQVQAAVEKAAEAMEHIDVLVNNAGVTRDGLLLSMSDEEWDLVIAVNLKGTFNLIRAVGRQMLRQRSGSIINLASVSGILGSPGQANYAASKAGVIGLTKTLARELASRQVTVNAVAPGFIETEMTAGLSAEVRERMLAAIPLGRFGSAEEVAAAVEFLLGEGAAYVTGQVLHVGGGLYT